MAARDLILSFNSNISDSENFIKTFLNLFDVKGDFITADNISAMSFVSVMLHSWSASPEAEDILEDATRFCDILDKLINILTPIKDKDINVWDFLTPPPHITSAEAVEYLSRLSKSVESRVVSLLSDFMTKQEPGFSRAEYSAGKLQLISGDKDAVCQLNSFAANGIGIFYTQSSAAYYVQSLLKHYGKYEDASVNRKIKAQLKLFQKILQGVFPVVVVDSDVVKDAAAYNITGDVMCIDSARIAVRYI